MSNTQLTETARLISNNFGDGYMADTPDGLNTVVGAVTLSWDPIPYAQANTIRTFMLAHVGVPFLYTLARETVPRAWVWKTMTRGYPHPAQDSLLIQIEERFSL